jgi:hypothetical protein
MIGLDLDRQTPLDRSVMNILDNSVYAIQENFDEQRSIDSGDAHIHNSSASRNDSPDQFTSMIGINNNILDPRMTYDLGALKKKKNSLFQDQNDISSILPSSKDNSSFNISLLGGSQNKKGKKRKNKMIMSVALPKMKLHLGGNKYSEKHNINSFEKILEEQGDGKEKQKEDNHWDNSPGDVNKSFDLSARAISKKGLGGKWGFYIDLRLF